MKFTNPHNNTYQQILIAAEYRRQHKDGHLKNMLAIKSQDALKKYIQDHELWGELQDTIVFRNTKMRERV